MANNFELTFDADCWIPPASAHPDRGIVQNRPYCAFDAATEETVYSPAFRLPAAYTGSGTLKLDVAYMMASATSGDVVLACQVEAVTDGDSTDLDAGASYDTANTATVTVPGTAGYLDVATVTLTNKDSAAAGDMVRLKFYRDADAGGDTATGDLRFLVATLREEA